MKKTSWLGILVMAVGLLVFMSCETTQEIEVGILWKDDSRIMSSDPSYLALLAGEFDSQTDFEAETVDQIRVDPEDTNTHVFSISTGSACVYTAFVFSDLNSNAIYDAGLDIVLGYKYNTGDPGKSLMISVSAFY